MKESQIGATGTDMRGQQITFVPGGDCRGFGPDDLLDAAISLEMGANNVKGPAKSAMRGRAHELLRQAVIAERKSRRT